MKICSIVGARPQFVKYFAVSKAIEANNQSHDDPVNDELIHTGQHYDYNMSKLFFDELGIKTPEYHLEAGSGSHGKQTAEIIEKTEEILLSSGPDIVMVFGDTNSTLGGALAAAKLHIPIVHVESGLRSFNRHMPEELNRILTDRLSHLLLCPSKPAIDNLRHEGFRSVTHHGELTDRFSDDVFTTEQFPLVANSGDVMYDVFLLASELAREKSEILSRLQLSDQSFGLMTLHRAENTDDEATFLEILSFLDSHLDGRPVLFPVHPRTAPLIKRYRDRIPECVQTMEAVSYFDLLLLLHHSEFVLTDSGGLQKEAYWAKKPCVTLRRETEWTETVSSRWNQLYRDFQGWRHPEAHPEYYGDGHAAERILALCRSMHRAIS